MWTRTVDGAELDLAFQATENFDVGVSFAYAAGEMDDGVVACNDFNRDGVPDSKPPSAPSVEQILIAAGSTELVRGSARVLHGQRSTVVRAGLERHLAGRVPVSDHCRRWISSARGLYSYYTSNEQDPNNAYDDVDAYGLLNLYAGLRSSDGVWEVAVFARNALDTEEVLGRGAAAVGHPFTLAAPALPGQALAGPYMTRSFTPPQEFGLSVLYSFGSR